MLRQIAVCLRFFTNVRFCQLLSTFFPRCSRSQNFDKSSKKWQKLTFWKICQHFVTPVAFRLMIMRFLLHSLFSRQKFPNKGIRNICKQPTLMKILLFSLKIRNHLLEMALSSMSRNNYQSLKNAFPLWEYNLIVLLKMGHNLDWHIALKRFLTLLQK